MYIATKTAWCKDLVGIYESTKILCVGNDFSEVKWAVKKDAETLSELIPYDEQIEGPFLWHGYRKNSDGSVQGIMYKIEKMWLKTVIPEAVAAVDEGEQDDDPLV